MAELNPSAPSSAYEATLADRRLIADVVEGLPAMRRQSAKTDVYRYDIDGTRRSTVSCSPYLTRWPDESELTYSRRLDEAVFTPLFGDLLFGLTSKPFSREVSLRPGISAQMEALAEDIDGEGNNLHVFAHTVFEAGVKDGLCAVFVDYPVVDAGLTRAQEQEMRVRPYWVRVEYADLLALYTTVIGGVEVITHARIRERTVDLEGFEEVETERVRVLTPGTWEIWEVRGEGKQASWQMTESGVSTIGVVPLTVFYAGKRMGPQHVKPPLVNLARMQVELFRKENNLKSVLNRTGFPIIAMNGVSQPTESIDVGIGPGTLLYSGPGASVEIIEPNGATMEQLREDIAEHKQEMRRLGMQPLLSSTGSVTATATGVEAAKAHSIVQQWALGLKDTLENAFRLTAGWLGETVEPEVFVHTDFGADIQNAEDIRAVLSLRDGGDLSREATLTEMKRRGVLAGDFDIEADAILVEAEAPDLPPIASGFAAVPEAIVP